MAGGGKEAASVRDCGRLAGSPETVSGAIPETPWHSYLQARRLSRGEEAACLLEDGNCPGVVLPRTCKELLPAGIRSLEARVGIQELPVAVTVGD